MEYMKIEIEVSEDCESTSAPYWLIIDPKQNLSLQRDACYRIASMITGPFFSRNSAQEFLDATRYNFGKNAVVYCHSGCYSREYSDHFKSTPKKEAK